MDGITPGRKLILDLLAKSVAKIQAESADAGSMMKKEEADIEPADRKAKRKSGKEGSGNAQENEVKVETQDSRALGNFVIEQQAKPVKRKIKTENAGNGNETKNRKKHKKKEYFFNEKAGQEDPIDTKSETLKIKNENADGPQHGASDCELPLKGSTATFSEGDLTSKFNVLIKESLEGGMMVRNKYSFKSKMENKTDKEDRKHTNGLKNRCIENNLGVCKGERNVIKGEHFKKCSAGKKMKRYTIEEDLKIMKAMEKFGDNINMVKLAKGLDRTYSSVSQRIDKLKTGETRKKNRTYTGEEDIIILDGVLKNLNKSSMETFKLSQSTWKDVGDLIGRGARVRQRWEMILKPWILQHYAGTFNLDIRRSLANYLADHFEDVNSIDWYTVASLPEFAGHTQVSLRHMFFSILTRCTQRKVKINDEEDITLRMIADVTNTVYLPGCRVESVKNVKRQKVIIEYYENYLETNSINNFLKK